MEEYEEEDKGMTSPLQSPDIIALVFARLSAPEDLLSASAVCRTWRIVATDQSHLRSWNLDDTLLDNFTLGTKTSSAPFLPKTPPPKQWINPTSFSPLSSFKIPKSLLTHHDQKKTKMGESAHKKTLVIPSRCKYTRCSYSDAFFFNGDNDDDIVDGDDDLVNSPRTPSPTREAVKFPPLFDIVKEKMVMGAFLGDIDIMSSRINDEMMQMLFRRCPRLHTFRLVHICPVKLNEYVEPFNLCMESGSIQHRSSCNCGPLSNRAFLGIHDHCPQLTSVTLILQHLTFRKVLRKLLRQIGGLPNLHTLSIELRPPSFGQSTKSKVIWDSHVRFTEQEIMALIHGGPPPLHALSLNRCDLTGASLDALVSACPHIEALELHSDFEDSKEPGFLQNAPLHLVGLASLSGVAFGLLMTINSCCFKSWRMPYVKRLRLETKHGLCIQHLYELKLACPELESLHLIWHSVSVSGGVNEVHIYPFTEENILKYPCSSCICKP